MLNTRVSVRARNIITSGVYKLETAAVTGPVFDSFLALHIKNKPTSSHRALDTAKCKHMSVVLACHIPQTAHVRQASRL